MVQATSWPVVAAAFLDRLRRALRAVATVRVPVDAAIGDRLAVGQRLAGDQVLTAGDEVGLDHDADDAAGRRPPSARRRRRAPAAGSPASWRSWRGWRRS